MEMIGTQPHAAQAHPTGSAVPTRSGRMTGTAMSEHQPHDDQVPEEQQRKRRRWWVRLDNVKAEWPVSGGLTLAGTGFYRGTPRCARLVGLSSAAASQGFRPGRHGNTSILARTATGGPISASGPGPTSSSGPGPASSSSSGSGSAATAGFRSQRGRLRPCKGGADVERQGTDGRIGYRRGVERAPSGACPTN